MIRKKLKKLFDKRYSARFRRLMALRRQMQNVQDMPRQLDYILPLVSLLPIEGVLDTLESMPINEIAHTTPLQPATNDNDAIPPDSHTEKDEAQNPENADFNLDNSVDHNLTHKTDPFYDKYDKIITRDNNAISSGSGGKPHHATTSSSINPYIEGMPAKYKNKM